MISISHNISMHACAPGQFHVTHPYGLLIPQGNRQCESDVRTSPHHLYYSQSLLHTLHEITFQSNLSDIQRRGSVVKSSTDESNWSTGPWMNDSSAVSARYHTGQLSSAGDLSLAENQWKHSIIQRACRHAFTSTNVPQKTSCSHGNAACSIRGCQLYMSQDMGCHHWVHFLGLLTNFCLHTFQYL